MSAGYAQEITSPCYTGNVTVSVACAIALRYRGRIPSWRQLVRDYGMSRATAFRWIRAMRDAGYERPSI